MLRFGWVVWALVCGCGSSGLAPETFSAEAGGAENSALIARVLPFAEISYVAKTHVVELWLHGYPGGSCDRLAGGIDSWSDGTLVFHYAAVDEANCSDAAGLVHIRMLASTSLPPAFGIAGSYSA